MNDTDQTSRKSHRKPDWGLVFAALDRAGVPKDFLADRNDDEPQDRGCMTDFTPEQSTPRHLE